MYMREDGLINYLKKKKKKMKKQLSNSKSRTTNLNIRPTTLLYPYVNIIIMPSYIYFETFFLELKNIWIILLDSENNIGRYF